ncbi:MAG: UDP-N-acetylglucosamine 2-epimerase [Aliarcobacter sp.]|jgi:GDP/UDP-N,N'-diacetylbacillosamine 2-epimerase (hydrolysing)|nr:UDP-N-acetylglucosamine 2-epimerase [Aliarcobacter sp.]
MKKICVVTGTKEEYTFLYKVLENFNKDFNIDLKLIVTGKHLSPDFGLTYKEIEKDFKIDKKIEMYPKLMTNVSISNSLGLSIIGFANAFEELKPDFILVCSNSYTTYGVCIVSVIANIPILNIFSNNLIDKEIPKSILDSIVKMSEMNLVVNTQEKNILEAYYNKSLNIEIFEEFNKINSTFLNNVRGN